MENKQIIDEIDISKCAFCEDSKYCYIYSGTADFKWLCEENEDCQIKNLLLQLKAKEQECEELKKQHQGDKGLITSTGKMNYQLIQEYDKLKTDKAEALEQLEFVRTLNTIREAENRKLEQTLTEIKEIAEEDFNHTCWETYARQLKQILQKISKVEECKP